MTLAVIFLALSVALYFALAVAGADLADLKAKRVAAGARLIELRNECQAPGFVESAEFDKKWDEAEDQYAKAQAAEESALQEETRSAKRKDLADRIKADSEKLDALHLSRMRPDYSPNSDPRSRAVQDFPRAEEWRKALRTWASVRSESFDPTEGDIAAVKRCRINLHSDSVRLPAGAGVMAMVEQFQEAFLDSDPRHRARAIRQVMAAWNTMTPESAGYIMQPPTVIQQLEVNRLAWGGLLQVATVRQTTTGEDILLPFMDDTTVSGRRIAEDGPLGTENNPKFGQIRWGAYKYTSDIIAATFEAMRDSMFDLETLIGDTGGQRLGRIQNKEATLGTGNSMPRGASFSAPVGVTTAANNAITYDEIIDLEMSVDDAYQNGDRVGFMMNKGILKVLRKLKDLNGLPLLQLAQETTTNRDELNGKPIFRNFDMPNALAASADVMLYGDYSKVVVRRVGGTRIVRDPYTKLIERDQVLFAAVEYMDSNTINAGTAPIKKMRMAA